MGNLPNYFSTIVLCAVLFFPLPIAAQAAAAAPAEAVKENVSAAAAEQDLIHAGDLIDVDVVGSTEYDWRGTLDAEGFLSRINFTENPIFALCQTEERVAAQIAAAYSRLLRSPQVSVKILDRSDRPKAAIFGAVRKLQRFQIKRRVFLNELIVVSGGFTDKASGDIQIIRPPGASCSNSASNKPNETVYLNIKIGDLLAGRENPQIFGGDIITVVEAKPIYVMGAVGVPKQIAVRDEITLTRALDSAGGVLKKADTTKVLIFRRGASQAIEADLDKIKSGQTADIALQAYDVVEVSVQGREKRKFPPVLKTDAAEAKTAQKNLPLQVID